MRWLMENDVLKQAPRAWSAAGKCDTIAKAHRACFDDRKEKYRVRQRTSGESESDLYHW